LRSEAESRKSDGSGYSLILRKYIKTHGARSVHKGKFKVTGYLDKWSLHVRWVETEGIDQKGQGYSVWIQERGLLICQVLGP